MRIAGAILALLFGLGLVLWKGAVVVVLGTLGLLRQGVEQANLTEAEVRMAIEELRRADIPVPPIVESQLVEWLREQMAAGNDGGLGGVWLGLALSVLVVILAVAALFSRSRVTGLMLTLAAGAGFYVGMAVSQDGWFSLASFAIATLGGLMALAGGGRPSAPRPVQARQRSQAPPPPPPSSRPPPPPPPPRG
jgi:hypothetical protein